MHENPASCKRRHADTRTSTENAPTLANQYFEIIADAVEHNGGEVHYGNIGSRTRIDFTVMGQAVNTTANIEGLCSKFDNRKFSAN